MNVRFPLLPVTGVFIAVLVPAAAQIAQIDPNGLPPDPSVQSLYTELSPVDQYARTYETTWRFPVPKKQLGAQFTRALHTPEQAEKQNPSNAELQLFTGLVAHLTYNLDVEEAYEPAMAMLQPLAAKEGHDFRAARFLGIHQCQSNDNVGGMNRLLSVEALATNLPRAFWQDYANCASVSFMPAHAIRAYDNAAKVLNGPSTDAALEGLARNRVRLSNPADIYPTKEVWSYSQDKGSVAFTSTLCGESFTTRPNTHLNLSDVKQAKCVVSIETDQFPNRHDSSSATLLLLTMPPAFPAQSIDEFASAFLNDPKYVNRQLATGIPCPVPHCVAYEIRSEQMYNGEGGAHLLAVFFQSEEPAYPGLRFETPQPLPKPDSTGKPDSPTFYRPKETHRRFSGPLCTVAVMDANEDIYLKARPEFESLMKSLVIDTK